jgi:hypothetical protein
MATYVPAKKNTAFIFYVGLYQQADTRLLKANPTLAAADFNVSTDGGALGALATTPTVTPASGRMVKISLSSGEMNGDNITVVCSDSAGAEWCDLIINIQTAARQVDDLAYPATSGRSMNVSAGGVVDADMTAVSTDSTAADNLETMLDGTGGQTLSLGKLNVVAAAGVDAIVATGGAASGATPAGHGLVVTGGAASTTGGGVAGEAIQLTGGAGAASTNGAVSGLKVAGGGTNTVASSADAVTLTATSNGAGVRTTGSGTGEGIRSAGGSISGKGALFAGNGTGDGVTMFGGGTSGVGCSVRSNNDDAVKIVPATGHGINIDMSGANGKSGVLITGASANGATPAAAAVKITGGGASTTGGGTSSEAIQLIGGAGAASTNGAAPGFTSTGGGVTTVSGNTGATFTGTGNANGVTMAGAGTGRDLSAPNASIFSMTDGVEAGLTPLQEMRLTASASAGKLSGAATTTVVIRNAVADSKDRITATVDASGNRTAITTDVT